MRLSRLSGLILLVILSVSLTGCIGGFGTPSSETYKLTITVQDESGNPLEGVRVEIVGSKMIYKNTDAQGKATFAGLSGTIEILASKGGYETVSKSFAMTKDRSETITLNSESEDEENLVQGLVIDTVTGKALSGVTITIDRETYVTDNNGIFLLQGISGIVSYTAESQEILPANIASVHFWGKVISEYTNGQFELVKAYPRTEYPDGTLGDVYFFESK